MRPGKVACVVLLSLVVVPPAGLAASRASVEASAAGQDELVPGELIVAFRDSAGQAARDAALDQVAGKVKRRLPGDANLIRVQERQDAREAARALERLPSVRFAQPNFYRHTAPSTPNDPFFTSLWGLNNTGQTVLGAGGTSDADIDAPEAWDTQTGSRSVTVAVTDSGVAHGHPDLQPNIWSNPNEIPLNEIDDDLNGHIDDSMGWDFVSGDPDPGDLNGHGTHVAGTIGAVGNNATGITGVAWQVSLMPVRIADEEGGSTDVLVAEGFAYAAEAGARVVNGSITGPDESPAIAAVVAEYPETLFVIAAGNKGQDNDNDTSPQFPCNVPAPNLVCVAATDRSDGLASFSNYGAASVDLAAPGVNIRSTFTDEAGYRYLNGTSTAAPHVSGAAALLLSEEPSLTAGALRQALLSTVDLKAALSGKVVTGGRLNVARALASVAPPPDTRPPITRITSSPRSPTTRRTVRFRFTSNEPGSRFKCRIDSRAYYGCTSPRSYRLGRGLHTFKVRAIDAAGNRDPTPAIRRFRII